MWGAGGILGEKRGRLLFRPPQHKPRGRSGRRSSLGGWLTFPHRSLLLKRVGKIHLRHFNLISASFSKLVSTLGGPHFGPLPCSLLPVAGMSCENTSCYINLDLWLPSSDQCHCRVDFSSGLSSTLPLFAQRWLDQLQQDIFESFYNMKDRMDGRKTLKFFGGRF